jgi:hypothetical protein
MKKKYFIQILFIFLLAFSTQNVYAQCAVDTDTNSILSFNEPGGSGPFNDYLCLGTDSVGSAGFNGYYDGDGYRIKLVSGSQIIISVDNCSGNPVSITIADSANQIISGLYSAAACPNTLSFSAPYTGEFIVVLNLNGVCNGGGTTIIGQAYTQFQPGSIIPDCPIANIINDTICGALPLTLDGPFIVGNTADAFPTDPIDSYIISIGYNCSSPNNTMWYSFTSSIDIDTSYLWLTSDVGSQFHSWLVAFIANDTVNSCSAPLTYLGCEDGPDDFAGIDTVSIPIYGINANTVFYFMIDGYSGLTGGFSITLKSTPFVVSVPDIFNEKTISVYPNPVSHTLHLNSSVELLKSSVSILNSFGQILFTKSFERFTGMETDVSSFGNGIYYIEVSNTHGLMRKKLLILN